MDVMIDGRIANRRLFVRDSQVPAARKYTTGKYGRVKIVTMPVGDGTALYWVS